MAKNFVCLIGLHKFVAGEITNEYEKHFEEFIGWNVEEKCILCPKERKKFYFHGDRTYPKSRTRRNTEKHENKMISNAK